MSQATDFTLSNQPGASFRTELNTIIQALASQHSGAGVPPLTYPGMLWAQLVGGEPVMLMRNGANTAWLVKDPNEFGLGINSEAAVASIDAVTLSGFYRIATGDAGRPPVAGSYRCLHIAGAGLSQASQMAIHETLGRVFFRLRDASSWQAWVENPLAGAFAVSDFAAAAIRVLAEGFASPLDTELATAAWVNGLVLSNPWTYTSSAQTITSGSSLTLAHGLGARPTEVRLVVRCTTAQAPYAVGDEVEVTDFSGASQWGASIAADATNLIIRTGAGGHFLINNAGNAVALTNGSWRYIARAR